MFDKLEFDTKAQHHFNIGMKMSFRVARWFIFKRKIQIWVNLEGRGMENDYTFYGHLEYFLAIWCNLGIAVWYILSVIWDIFPLFGMFGPRNIWQP
jgi:hypothetical protein